MSELNLEERINVKNLCNWDLYFSRIESVGDVKVPQNGMTRLTRHEIQSQVYNGNKFFVGTNGQGSHAKVYIDDKATRVLVGFETEDENDNQNVVDVEKIKAIFASKGIESFKKNIKESIKLQSEKFVLFNHAVTVKLNDLDKVKFIEEYTGYKFEQ